MTKLFLSIILQRFLLPLILCASIAVRPLGLSFIYLIFVFILPYIPIIAENQSKSKLPATIYFSLLISSSTLIVLTQITFQVLWFTKVIEWSNQDLRNVGIKNLLMLSPLKILNWTLADIVPFFSSIIIFVILKKLGKDRRNEQSLSSVRISSNENLRVEFNYRRLAALKLFGIISSLTSLCFSGAIFSSPVNVIYFLSFLAFTTYMSCNRSLFKKFAVFLRLISILILLQLTIHVIYQIPWINTILKDYKFIMNLMGFFRILLIDHSSNFEINSKLQMHMIFQPGVLMVSYYVLVTTANFIMALPVSNSRQLEVTRSKRIITLELIANKIEDKKYHKMIDNLIKNLKSFFADNAYIVAVFSMMIYSILFHSWIGFTFLLGSNIIWLLPNRSSKCKMMSPFILLYAMVILITNYIFDMRIYDLNANYEQTVKQIGLKCHDKFSIAHLIVKVLLMLPYFILLHQKFVDSDQEKVLHQVESFIELRDNKWTRVLKRCIIYLWMWIVVLLLFVTSVMGDHMNFFRIINMSFVLIFLIVFQISFELWAKIMYTFCLVLIVYANLQLILVYVFQFSNFPELPFFEMLGLYKLKTTELFVKLLSLTVISILCAIQLNYLHVDFLKIFNLSMHVKETQSFAESSKEKIKLKLRYLFEKLFVFVEIHFHKAFFTITFLKACMKIQAVNLLGIIFLLIGAKSIFSKVKNSIQKLIAILCAVYIILIMVYDLTKPHVTELLKSHGITQLMIFKIEEMLDIENGRPIIDRISKYVIVIIVTTLYSTLRMRQCLYFRREEQPKLLFEDISRREADESVVNLIKFLFNYGFYKFGNEISLIVMLVIITLKMDIVPLLYIPFLIFMAFKKNLMTICKITKNFCLILILMQVFGLAYFEVHDEFPENEDVTKFLDLIFGKLRKNPSSLVFDYILLMTLSCQCYVLRKSKLLDFTEDPFQFGGENSKTFPPRDYKHMKIYKHPIYTFSDKINSTIDILKRFVFKVNFWLTISIIFITGTHQVDIFSLIYIICSFIFLWQGTEFYLKPLPSILNQWNLMLAYNVVTLAIKIILEVLEQFSSTKYCLNFIFHYGPCSHMKKTVLDAKDDHFYWDLIAFLFIIVQRKIFNSYYFYNIIKDTQITKMLASRGAKIIEELRIHEMNQSIEEERSSLEKLRNRMEVIKGTTMFLNQEKRSKIKSHDLAIRTGDIYMFAEDFSDEETHFINQAKIRRNAIDDTRAPRSSMENQSYLEDDLSEVEVESVRQSEEFMTTCTKYLRNLFYEKIYEGSKEHTYIIKLLNREKKYLKDAMMVDNSVEDELVAKSSFEIYQSKFEKANTRISKQMQFELKSFKQSHSNTKIEIQSVTFIEVLRELFYFMLTHTSLLVYLIIFINQILSANIMSLPLPLLIFLWGSLTFPRPSKFFWVLLIAYVKAVIVIKCLAQLDFVWWNREHIFIKFFGINRNENFALYDLILVMALFIHRAVLKSFGLWKEENEANFHEGTFEVDRCDVNSKTLIKQNLMHGIKSNKISDTKIPSESTQSGDMLLEESMENISVLYRHEFNHEKNEIDSIYQKRTKLLRASEEIFCDNQGRLSMKLKQENIKLRLQPINIHDAKKNYPIQRIVTVENEIQEPIDFYPNILFMVISRYASLTSSYLNGLFTKYRMPRKPVDMYTLMFFFEFVNFFVLVFGFSTFGIQPTSDNSRSILHYFEENRVPTSLLFLVIIQFAVIIIDRILYLRKCMVGKVIFQFFIIATTHIWMFLVLPIISSKSFNSSLPPILFYFIKCIYLLVSAYQIRCGYPRRVLGNFLMKKFDDLHLIAYKAYLHIPFLFEFRTVFDWLCIPSSLTLFEWIRIEAIHAQVYQIKCQRQTSQDQPRGVKINWVTKVLQGGGLTLLIILILWFPMVFFAYSSTFGNSNKPSEFIVQIQFVGYEPIYSMDVDGNYMEELSYSDWQQFKRNYASSPLALNFLDEFSQRDVVILNMRKDSSSTWNLSPPAFKKLVSNLKNESMSTIISITYKVIQFPYGERKIQADKIERKLDQKTCNRLVENLEDSTSEAVRIKAIFPKMFHIRNNGIVDMLSNDLIPHREDSDEIYNDIFLKLSEENGAQWWQVKQDCQNNSQDDSKLQDCENFLKVYVFNEKIFPNLLSKFAIKGVVGMYVTIIVVFWKVLRIMIINFSTVNIIVEELPNVDKILNLINNIKMVREAGEFALEEDLIAKLYFLYRSPETLFRFTKHHED